MAYKAIITYARPFTSRQNLYFEYYNPGGSTVYDLYLEVTAAGGEAILTYRNIEKTKKSKLIEINAEARATLLDHTFGSVTQGLILRLITVPTQGAEPEVDYETVQYTIEDTPDVRPTVSFHVDPVTPNVEEGEYWTEVPYLQGYSSLEGWIDVTTHGYMTSVMERELAGAGVNAHFALNDTFTSDVLGEAGEIRLTAFAKDSRGFTGTAAETISVQPYGPPTVGPFDENTPMVRRCNSGGVVSPTGDHIKIKVKLYGYPVAVYPGTEYEQQKNYLYLWARVKERENSFSENDWMLIYVNEDPETGDIPITSRDPIDVEYVLSAVRDVEKVYDVELCATDAIIQIQDTDRRVIQPCAVRKGIATLHLKEGGDGVGIGDYCEEDGTLRVGFLLDLKADLSKVEPPVGVTAGGVIRFYDKTNDTFYYLLVDSAGKLYTGVDSPYGIYWEEK